MEPHICDKEDLLREMSGDIKTLVAEFRAMNGSLQRTAKEFEQHRQESELHRYRITILWFVAQGIKWAVGGGCIVTILLYLFKK